MTQSYSMERLQKLAKEKSVRGAVVRQALRRSDEAGPEEQETLNAALHLLLEKFAAIPDKDQN